MSLIPWVRAQDALVGKGHPVKADTLNTPLRTLLTSWGYDPDASSLPSPQSVASTDATTKANAAQSNAQAYTDAARPTFGSRLVSTLAQWITGLFKHRYNAYDFNATGNGTTDDYTALHAMEAARASASLGINDLTPGTYKVGTNLSLGDIRFAPGAILKPASGVTITFTGTFKAHGVQCFDLSLGGSVVFTRGKVHTLDASWWFLHADGTTDDRTSLVAAVDTCWNSGIYRLRIPSARYALSNTLELFEGIQTVTDGRVTWRNPNYTGYDSAKSNGICFVPLNTFSGASVVRVAGASATPTPRYSQDTSSMGHLIENITVDLANAPSSIVAFTGDGVFFSHWRYCKVVNFTADTQVGFRLQYAAAGSGGAYWNTWEHLYAIGNSATPHGIGFQILGATDGSVGPTQTRGDNVRAQYCYRGIVIDYAGAGISFRASAWENCADYGVYVTQNQRTTGLPMFFGTESSHNGNYGYAGPMRCHETTAQLNGPNSGVPNLDYDQYVFRDRADWSNGYFSSTMPYKAPWFLLSRNSITASAGDRLVLTTPSAGQQQVLSGYNVIQSASAGPSLLDATTQIAAPGTWNMAILILRGGSNSNYVRLVDNAGLRLKAAYHDLILDREIILVYDSGASAWVEVSWSANWSDSIDAVTLNAGDTLTPGGDMYSVTGGAVGPNLLSTAQIATGKGKFLLLRGASNTSWVRIVNGGNVRLHSDAFDLTLDSMLLLAWSSVAGCWSEVCRTQTATGSTIVNKTVTYAAAVNDNNRFVLMDCSAGNKSYTLSTTLPVGWKTTVQKVDSSANSLTVSGTGCTINAVGAWGASSISTTTQGKGWMLLCISNTGSAAVFQVVAST